MVYKPIYHQREVYVVSIQLFHEYVDMLA